MQVRTKIVGSWSVLIAIIAIYIAGATPSNAVQGINYGWCRYPGFSTWLGSSFNQTSSLMNGDFSLITSGGKNQSIRIWIFPDGTSNINLTGPISTTFRSNVVQFISTANSYGLSVYVTFFSAWNQGDATTANEAALWTYDIEPILSDLVGHYNIFGVDVMNEFDGTGSNAPFCQYMISQIKAKYNIPVTASSNQAYATAVSDTKSIGGTYLDWHTYQNAPVTIPQNTSGMTGVIGEIGMKRGGSQLATLQSALPQYQGQGWSSIFAWDFALDDSWELTNGGRNWTAVSYNSAGSWWNAN